MRLEYRPQADADFEEIVAYYKSVAPGDVSGVVDDIERSMDLICDFPRMYPRQPGKAYRRFVTRKFRFKVVYQVFDDHLEVIGIFRFRNRDA